MSLSYNLYFLSSDLFLLYSSLILLLFGAFLNSNKLGGFPILSNLFNWISFKIVVFSIFLLSFQIPMSSVLWNGFLVSNYFTYFTKYILLGFVLIILSLSGSYFSIRKTHFFEFWILLLMVVVAISFIVHSFDFLSIYVSIELQSLIFYILASFNRTSEFSTEASLKYFILGAFASAFLLLGFAIIYNLTGISNLNDLSKLFSGFSFFDPNFSLGLTLGLTLILVAFLFKFNSAPFHFWSPDVYEGVPLVITAIFAILPKLALAGLLIKFLYFSFFFFLPNVEYFLILCCLLSSVIGILGAFLETKWKRFIAFSSIGHSSLILLSLISNDFFSLGSIFFFLVIYSLSLLLFFLIISSFSFFQFPKILYSRYMKDVKSLTRVNTLLSLYLLIVMFSLAGVPPLAGFFSKFFILFASLKNNLFILTVTLIILNCFSTFYYLRFSKLIYFDFTNLHLTFIPINKLNSIFMSLCVIFIIFLILDIDYLLMISKLMAFALIT